MRIAFYLFSPLALLACKGEVLTDPTPVSVDAGQPLEYDFGKLSHPCSTPGTLLFTPKGKLVVPGGAATPPLDWMKIPVGFCAHYFGNVGNGRQLRFAPGGELFVASPTTATTSGGQGGKASILILPDDNKDGVADTPITFLSELPSTQGLLFAGGYFYYQDHTKILRMPYKTGQRAPAGPSAEVADITIYSSNTHWPKTLDIADDGTIYVGNGGDEGETCEPSHPFRGGILKLDGSPGGVPIAKGFRNPISVQCARGHNKCFALELAKDYSGNEHGREKMLPIRDGDDWGFRCCATKDTPYPGLVPPPDCSGVASEDESFTIGDTPFGFDFEPGTWPAPYKGSAFIALHGSAGSWQGAKLVSVAMNPTTGLPIVGSNLPGDPPGGLSEFATGWETHMHGRPTSVAFHADGRLFLGNDTSGDIVWIAPMGTTP